MLAALGRDSCASFAETLDPFDLASLAGTFVDLFASDHKVLEHAIPAKFPLIPCFAPINGSLLY